MEGATTIDPAPTQRLGLEEIELPRDRDPFFGEPRARVSRGSRGGFLEVKVFFWCQGVYPTTWIPGILFFFGPQPSGSLFLWHFSV